MCSDYSWCLYGWGTELALACHGLVITDSSKTKLGLPEVKLGLLPGLGGTVRLYKRIGLPNALDYILTGKNMYASKAKKLGLADVFVDESFRLKAGIQLVKDIASGKHTTNKSKGLSVKDKALLFGPFKSFVISKAKDNVMAKTKGNYPAPLEILKCLEHHPGKSRDEAIKREIEGFTKLLHSPEARQLIRLFFLMNSYKKNPYSEDLSEAPEHLSVLGAGLMGNGISTVSIDNGYKVTLLDLSDDALKKAKKNTSEYLEKKVKRKQISRSDYQKLLNDLQLVESGEPVKSDALIEAVFEDLELKQKILKKWSEHLDSDVLIATNTSALPVTEIAEVCTNPERVIGMHYFSPVEKMPLLEIVKTEKTNNVALAKAYDIGLKQGKVCIDVSDGPAFTRLEF
nr:3-hydroxyacyl-CoA dehydrogenase NAD-binding domain-containing protein [Mangrovivirga cuniculi]